MGVSYEALAPEVPTWLVYDHDHVAEHVICHDDGAAWATAARLAVQHPDCRFDVFELVGTFTAPTPAAVGDLLA